MRIGQSQVTMQTSSKIKMNVVTIGRQGPVGTLPPDILSRLEAAEHDAKQAKQLSSQIEEMQHQMVGGMTMAIEHFLGVVSIQDN